jgi:CheY-like chemotaxis protein
VRLNTMPLEIDSVIDAALTSARPAASAKGITLARYVEPLAGPIPGDPDRLQQVVWNLLSNAIKFTPAGGEVCVRLRARDDQAEIRVEDNGIGIKEDFLPYVFDRFRQSDASSTRSHGGLGLGLSITRHLVEMHGGVVAAESPGEGRGATFTVLLPGIAPPATAAVPFDGRAVPLGDRADAATSASFPTLEGRRVLVVDDEPDSRRLLVHLLARARAIVRDAESVPAALALLEEWPADVLISDIAMPGEDGYGLIRRLRASPAVAWRTLPAIALTAFARAEDRDQALSAGFQMHMAKPFQPLALLTAVASLASVEPVMVASKY